MPIDYAFIWAALIAFAIGIGTRSVVGTIIGGMAALYLFQYLLA